MAGKIVAPELISFRRRELGPEPEGGSVFGWICPGKNSDGPSFGYGIIPEPMSVTGDGQRLIGLSYLRLGRGGVSSI